LLPTAGIGKLAGEALFIPVVLICELREGPEVTVCALCAPALGAFRSRFTNEDHGSVDAGGWARIAGALPICLLLS
jgi:hypothetical protein